MRTITLLFLFCCAFLPLSAQVFLNERFDEGSMPPDGWSIAAQAVNWSVAASSNAGGEAPEARFTWTPAFTGDSRLVSQSLDLSSNTTGVLVISFRHMLDHWGGPYTIGLAVRSRGGAWEPVWAKNNPSGDIPAQQITLELDSEVVSSDDFQLAFYFTGNSYNLNDWYIDDVRLMAPREFDLAVTAINVPDMFYGAMPVMGSVTNVGLETIHYFELHWQLDDGQVYTTQVEGLALDLNDQYHFEADDLIDAAFGQYSLNVFISNVNGQEEDDDPENDSLTKSISVAYQETARRPMFEMFTSSTCPPCATFNNGFFNHFAANHADDMALIKYQMNWPGAGDPYYTAEGGVRRLYYGVSGVPSLYLEGNSIATNGTLITNGLQQALQVPSYVDIEGSFLIEGDQVLIEGALLPYAGFQEVRLHVVVIESATYGNASTNGETIFHHVMHKMLPDAQGAIVSLSALETYEFSHQFDMSVTNVEEMDELMVVVFLQNHATREVYQSAYLTKQTVPVIAFDLADGSTGVLLDRVFVITSDQYLRHEDGAEITSESLYGLINLYEDGEDGQHHAFSASLNEAHTQITVSPDGLLAHNTNYRLELLPVMGTWGHITDIHAIGFTTEDHTHVYETDGPDIHIYPNPASSVIYIDTSEGNGFVRIFDISGKPLLEQPLSGVTTRIDLYGLREGSYILEVVSGRTNRSTHRFSIIKP